MREMKQSTQTTKQLLLLEDVIGLGRQGELVTAKPGYIRNYLLPQKKAVIANKATLKLQERLKKERAEKAVIDRQESEALAKTLVGQTISIVVKTDTQGKLYGSVTTLEIANLAKEAGFSIERHNIVLAHPVKSLGMHKIALRLKEQVEASIELNVIPEHPESIVKKASTERVETAPAVTEETEKEAISTEETE
jgi:large subunit ribosomal protein L9